MTLKSKKAPYKNPMLTGREEIVIYGEDGKGQVTSIANLLNRIDANLFKIQDNVNEDFFLNFDISEIGDALTLNMSYFEGLTQNIQDFFDINGDPLYFPYSGFVPAASGDQSDATLLNAAHSVVVVGGDGYSAKLPIGFGNNRIVVDNWRNYTLVLYPASGDNFNGPFGEGANEPIILNPFEIITCYAVGDVGMGGKTWIVKRNVEATTTGSLQFKYSGAQTTAVTSLEVLETYTLVGGTVQPGDFLEIEANWQYGPNTNSKRARVKCFSEVIGEHNSSTASETASILIRIGNDGSSIYGTSKTISSSGDITVTPLGILGDWTVDNNIEFTGENMVASAGDITLFDLSIKLIKAIT